MEYDSYPEVKINRNVCIITYLARLMPDFNSSFRRKEIRSKKVGNTASKQQLKHKGINWDVLL